MSRHYAAQIAALRRWGREPNAREATRPAREAFLRRFEREADPDGVLTIEERRVKTEKLRRAYFISIRARRNTKAPR